MTVVLLCKKGVHKRKFKNKASCIGSINVCFFTLMFL